MRRRPNARRTYRCIECGIILAGRMDPKTGTIHAYDRSPSENGRENPDPCTCAACLADAAPPYQGHWIHD